MEALTEIGKKIAKLIDVKSILTLALTGVVCYQAINGSFDIKEIYLMIIAFYFGTQAVKPKEKETYTENINEKEDS